MRFRSFEAFLLEQDLGSDLDIDEMSKSELIFLIGSINEDRVDESNLRKLFGAATGIVLGRRIMKLLLRILNIRSGPLYNILTSKTVLARVGYEFGKHSKK